MIPQIRAFYAELDRVVKQLAEKHAYALQKSTGSYSRNASSISSRLVFVKKGNEQNLVNEALQYAGYSFKCGDTVSTVPGISYVVVGATRRGAVIGKDSNGKRWRIHRALKPQFRPGAVQTPEGLEIAQHIKRGG